MRWLAGRCVGWQAAKQSCSDTTYDCCNYDSCSVIYALSSHPGPYVTTNRMWRPWNKTRVAILTRHRSPDVSGRCLQGSRRAISTASMEAKIELHSRTRALNFRPLASSPQPPTPSGRLLCRYVRQPARFRVQVFVPADAAVSHQVTTSKEAYFSMAQFIVTYARMSGGAKYRIWPLVLRYVLKTAALRVPASGRCRLADSE